MKSIFLALVAFKSTAQAMFAAVMRRFDNRMLILVGLFATFFAIFSFAIDNIVAKKANPRSDAILKLRLSGPEPSTNILIVDIDERSLATLSSKYGNWPWPRDVLADGVQRLADLNVRGVLFNVMMSDPDRGRPDSDAAMDVTAALFESAAFPIIRLNPKNDNISKLDVRTLPGAVVQSGANENPTVAAVIPFFKSMQTRIGVSNQLPDKDGIVRRYPYVWKEEAFSLPSIVKMTLDASGIKHASPPDTMTLNWRNKKGRYQRISFVDVLRLEPNTKDALRFKDAIVVLGVSAPGIGQIKPTAVTAIEDDNEILATAIDDAVHGTFFRTIPGWVTLIISIISLWGLVYLAIIRIAPEKINRVFILLQLGLAAVMLLLASYTYLLIDLSDSMSFVLLVFAAVKLIRTMSDNSARARPGYRKASIDPIARTLVLAGYRRKHVGLRTRLRWEQRIQKLAGMQHVIRIDDLFGGNSFLSEQFSDYEALIILTRPSNESELLSMLGEEPSTNVKIKSVTLPENIDIANQEFRTLVAGLLIRNAADLYAI
jgi:CHASE2 domain-containing sensor protein